VHYEAVVFVETGGAVGSIAPVVSGETPDQHATGPNYCTVKALQTELGGPDCISRMTIYRLIRDGELDAIQVSPQKILILRSSITAWLERSRVSTETSATPTPGILPPESGSRSAGEEVA
jgi:excisionase family DNA binding protein